MTLKHKFLTLGLVVMYTGLLLSLNIYDVHSANASNSLPSELDPNKIPKFINQFTIPPVFDPKVKVDGKGNVYHEYNIDVTEFKQQILPPRDLDGNKLNSTLVWGYGGVVKNNPETGKKDYFSNAPGATFEAVQGIPVKLKWENKITGDHLFPVDPTLHWANPNEIAIVPSKPWPSYPPGFIEAQSPIPLVPHLHGGEVSSDSDGHPEAWWTANGLKGDAYVKDEFTYPNQQNPTTLWYHDHALGMTRLNVMSGLAGFYLLRDRQDSIEAKLPKGDYEVPLVIQDRSFRTDGSFLFDEEGVLPDIHPYWTPEFFGNTIMVNGKVWPNFDVQKRQYRFRILNGSNARFYDIRFSNGMSFIQIGSDGGYLPSPVTLTNLVIAPGERADILVDFSNINPGENITLQNHARAPYPSGDPVDPNTTGTIMQFSISSHNSSSVPAAELPNKLNTIPNLSPQKTRTLTLTEVMAEDEIGESAPMAALLNGQKWSAEVSEMPRVGTTEDWQIVNLTGDTHPIHLHLVQFQVVGRYQLKNLDAYEEDWLALNNEGLTDQYGTRVLPFKNDYKVKELSINSYIDKDALIKPAANERGWKDTLQMNPGEVTVIRIRVAPQNADSLKVAPGVNLYPFDPTKGPGYVWHCHILDHEDNEMMRPMKIAD